MIVILKRIGQGIAGFFLLLFFLIGLQYALCPIYRFPEPRPFSGEAWYNPYHTLRNYWYKANFQVQSLCWLGLTDGKDQTEDIYRVYKDLDYDVITISDYQYINPFKGLNVDFIPVYEHGYNIKKRHQVLIGAKRVEWRDYPFGQNLNHKQHMINMLKKSSRLVVIAHPVFMHGYTPADMAYLTGYDGIEVINHYRKSIPVWDAALSAGRIGWIYGDDDSHKIQDPAQTGVCWTMINSDSGDQESILEALSQGRMFAVQGKGAINRIKLIRCEVKDERFVVQWDGLAGEIRFIGQNGTVLKTDTDCNGADIQLLPEYTYVRTEIRVQDSEVYMNPIVRYDGNALMQDRATVDVFKTWLQRSLIFAGTVILCFLVIRFRKSKK